MRQLWRRYVQILISEKLILLLSILLWTSQNVILAENFFFLFWFFFDFLAVSSMVTYPTPQFVENSFCLCMVLLGLNDVFTDFLCPQISKSHHMWIYMWICWCFRKVRNQQNLTTGWGTFHNNVWEITSNFLKAWLFFTAVEPVGLLL